MATIIHTIIILIHNNQLITQGPHNINTILITIITLIKMKHLTVQVEVVQRDQHQKILIVLIQKGQE